MNLGLEIKELAGLVHVTSDTIYKLGAEECQNQRVKSSIQVFGHDSKTPTT